MNRLSAFLGLGSNEAGREGSPRRQLEKALDRFPEFGVDVVERSRFYRTEPVGGPAQPWFVNAVARLRPGVGPLELLRICQSIEALHERRRTVPDGPRTLDLDVLVFGDLVLETPELTLPHPRLAERRFVLLPLVEIAPELRHPRSGLTMRELLERCTDRSLVEALPEAVAANPSP